MALTLTVDGDRWRRHLRSVAEAMPGIVPVAKGNGYGLTVGRLARKAQWLDDQLGPDGLGVDTLAVGTYEELPGVADRFGGSLLVLTPWRPFVADLDTSLQQRVIHTVSRPDDLPALLERQPGARYVLERLTSMKRHGLTASELWALADVARSHRGRPEGVALHLPLARGQHLAEATRLMNDVVGMGLDKLDHRPGRPPTVWVSHLTGAELDELRAAYADFTIRPRVGTSLWLGVRDALRVTATVLDVHHVRRGETYGYRGRSVTRSGQLMIVSGGTAHGIGLSAPTGDSSLRSRAAAVARGGLDAAGLVRSPYFVDGQQCLFAEPPHMQASMLLLPPGATAPQVGDEIDVRVRYTTTDFDRVVVT